MGGFGMPAGKESAVVLALTSEVVGRRAWGACDICAVKLDYYQLPLQHIQQLARPTRCVQVHGDLSIGDKGSHSGQGAAP